MANTSTLIDALTGTTLNTSNWMTPVTNTNTSITPTAGGLVLANAIGCTTAQTSFVNSVNTAFAFDSISFKLTNVTTPANSGFYVAVFDTANNTIKVSFVVDSGNLACQIDGVTQGSAVPFNAINHKWLKLSTTGANVVFQASQDGVTWNTLVTYSTSDPLAGLGSFISIGTFTDATLVASSSFTVSNLNVGPLAPPVINDWLAGYDIVPAAGTAPGDLDTYASQAFNFLAQPPYARAIQTVAQSMAITVWNLLSLDTIQELNNCTFASSTFTATQPGWYSLNVTINANPPVGTICQVAYQFSIGGTTVGPLIMASTIAEANPWTWNCYDEIYLSAGDTVQVYFQHTAVAAFSTVVATGAITDQSSLEIAWLSE